MRIRGVTGLVAGLVLALGVTSASGHRAQAPTSLELVNFADSNGDTFSDYIIGTVSSPKGRCEGSRTVKITRRSPGLGGAQADRLHAAPARTDTGPAAASSRSTPSRARSRSTRKTLGGLVCEADSVDFD